jgi:thiol-disulfide isomerase/thioredoxin
VSLRIGSVRAALFVVAILAEAAGAQVTPSLGPMGASRDRVGYDWTLQTLDGEPVPLEDYRGHVLFVNAWASWCVPCVREMASIERLAARVADTDTAFLLVAVEGERPVRRHLRRYPVSLPVLLEGERFPPVFGLRGIPMTWIVDRDGGIAFRHFGAADWDVPAVETFLRDLDGEPPTPLD